ncbi:TPA: chemotaxis protein CheR, partial [Candidatus Latescibacteria bacterium]|nr:chemotaxis protein CheR [Candidatus Latescibacterota bacterium]
TTAGGSFQINGRISAMTEFFWHNLSRPWPADGQKDVILLRNVLIYFEESARRKILERM